MGMINDALNTNWAQWVVFPLPSPRLLPPLSSVSSSSSRTRLVHPSQTIQKDQ